MSQNYAFDRSPNGVFKHSPHHVRNSGNTRIGCDTVRCRAVYPLNGIAPIPAYLHGTFTLSYGDDAADLTAFDAATVDVFDCTDPGLPSNGGIASFLYGGENALTKYRKIDHSTKTLLYDTSDAPEGAFEFIWTYERLIHGTAADTETFDGFLKDYAQSGAVTCDSVDAVEGEYGSKSISNAGVVTSTGDLGNWRQGSLPGQGGGEQLFWPGSEVTAVSTFVLTFPGSYVTVDIAATIATMTVHIPHDALITVLGIPEDAGFYPAGFDVTSSFTLSEPASAGDLSAVTLDLLNVYDITTANIFTTNYAAYGLGGDAKLHRNASYVTWLDGPRPGVALLQKIAEESWYADIAIATAERIYAGGVYASHFSTTYAPGCFTLAKSWAATNGARACLYSQEWILPTVETAPPPALTGSDPGHLDPDTDDCDGSFPQAAGVAILNVDAPNDLMYSYGVAQLYRGCKGEPCCPVTITLDTPVNLQACTSPVSMTASARATGHTINKVEFWANGVKVGEDASAPYTYSWSASPGNYNVFARVIYDTTKHKDSAIALISVA